MIGGRIQVALRHWGLTAIIGALAVCACAYGDAVTNAYATKAEAEQSGAVDRGWVPKGLPASTHELREAHSPEGNRIWGLFNFEPREGDALRALLQPEEIPATGLRPAIPPRIEWWPLLLRGTLNADQIKTASLQLYRTKDGVLVMVVNWKQGRAYYWN